jgi:hypothetical protein
MNEAAPNTDSGYAIWDHVFDEEEMRRVLAALATANLQRTRAGARHVLSVGAVKALADDTRLVELAARFVGRGAVPFRATLFDKSPDANWLVAWHQDTALPLRRRVDDPDWGPWSTKAGVLHAHSPAWALERVVALRVHLDDSTSTNGPLRVLPDTHRLGVLQDDEVERLAREIAAIDCTTPAGGVIAMRPLTVHASSKSIDECPRRVLHIEYADSVRLGPQIELAPA